GAALTEALTATGQRCVPVTAGDCNAALPDGRFILNPGAPSDAERLLAAALPPGAPPLRGLAFLWALDAGAVTSATELRSALEQTLAGALHIVQALLRRDQEKIESIWLVTRGAQGMAGSAAAPAALWGLGRTLALEHPHLRTTLVDLDPASTAVGA